MDETTNTSINGSVALIKGPDERFRLVLRWMLGDKSDLPRDDDQFKIGIRRAPRARLYLDQHGQWVNDPDTRIWVAPKRFFMIDPPRRQMPVPYPGYSGQVWDVASEPRGPVDCNSSAAGTLRDDDGNTAAFGVCHLLAESEPSRVRWRVGQWMADALWRAHDRQAAQGARLAAFGASDEQRASIVDEAARTFATWLVDRGVRPMDLVGYVAVEVNALQTRDARVDVGPFALADAPYAAQWEIAALVVDALTEPDAIERLEAIADGPKQARQQVRLSFLQGGDMIDFWCGPEGATAQCSLEQRGRRYPAAEVLGVGLTIGEFTPAEVADWGTDYVRVTVDHVPAPPPDDRSFESGIVRQPGNLAAQDLQFTQGRVNLTPEQIQAALDSGTSHPPASPRSTRVNWDLVQTNAGYNASQIKEQGQIHQPRTGDGRVEILIEPANEASFAFNVYGVWEGASGASDAWFDENDIRPELTELAPFLMTRRYSYVRDLKHAFPGNGDNPAPLMAALAVPPPLPELRRADEIRARKEQPEEGEPEDHWETLPNVENQTEDGRPLTAFSFDLRTGMPMASETPPLPGWDLAAPPAFDWRPEQDRDGGDVPWPRPQRYRFWVTAVDYFGQESAPIPVRTDDPDLGDERSFLFEPRRRAPLQPAPARDAGDTGAVFEIAEDGDYLRVRWETPYRGDISGQTHPSSATSARLPAEWLDARVQIYRRRLVRPVGPPSARLAPASGTPDELPPQWTAEDERLRAEGYVPFKNMILVQEPETLDRWEARVPLSWRDRGFEYVAAVGFAAKQSRKGFFVPSALRSGPTGGRLVQLIVPSEDGQGYRLTYERRAETPAASDIATTDPYPAIDRDRPRGPKLDGGNYSRAEPVLPPPGMDRDDILARILSREFTHEGQPHPPCVWADTEVELTAGQRISCETALQRAAAGNVVADPRLAWARRLLAKDAARELDQERQHLSIGFRGLQTIRWRYDPIQTDGPEEPSTPGAEAVAFRVDMVRVPAAADAAQRYATIAGQATADGGKPTYIINDIADRYAESVTTLVDLEPPTAVRMADDEDPSRIVYGTVREARLVNGKLRVEVTWAQTTDPPPTPPQPIPPPPTSGAMQLYAGQPLGQIPVAGFDAPTDYEVVLPMGGGHAETFAWWVTSISAQGRQSSADRRISLFQTAAPSVAPNPPTLATRLPFGVDADFLDPSVSPNRPFLPDSVQTINDAKFSPRAVLGWANVSNGVDGIEIIRREARIQESTGFDALSMTLSPWDALVEVDESPPGHPLRLEAVEILASGWLLGEPITGASPRDDEGWTVIPASAGLNAHEGLGRFEFQFEEGSRTLPGLADYRRSETQPQLSMDANWRYEYRAVAFLDVDPSAPDLWRFLRSRPSPWTAPIVPETPPIKVSFECLQPRPLTEVAPPIVTLRFISVPEEPRHRAQAALDSRTQRDRRWLYRIVVRRFAGTSIASDPNREGEAAWVDVDQPRLLEAGDNKGVIVTDRDFDRLNLEDTPLLRYRLIVHQFVRSQGNEAEFERPVRSIAECSQEEYEVLVDAPFASGNDVCEVEVRRLINLR